MKAAVGCAVVVMARERESDVAVDELKPPRLGTPVEVDSVMQRRSGGNLASDSTAM